EAGPTTGGQHDSRSNNCDYSGGLLRDWHDYAGRGRQAEKLARLLPTPRVCVLDAAVRHRHGLRTQHLCAGSFGSVEHPDHSVRPEDGSHCVLGPEHAGGSNGLCAQSKNKLPVSLKSWPAHKSRNSSGAIGRPLSVRQALNAQVAVSAFGGKAAIAAPACACQSLNFFKDLTGRLHGGYIAASSLPS